MSEHRLDFLNPMHVAGKENMTCRKGARVYQPGDVLHIYKTGGEEEICTGEITKMVILYGKEISDDMIKAEHDSTCRNREGLFSAMDKAYGKLDWNAELLTLVYYVVGPVNQDWDIETA